MRGFRNKLQGMVEKAFLFALDIASFLLLFELAHFLRTDVLPGIFPVFPPTIPPNDPLRFWWIFLVWIFFFYYEGLYSRKFSHWDEIKTICKASFFAAVAIFAIASIGKISESISRTIIALMGLSAFVLLPALRMSAKEMLRKIGLLKRRVLILGAGDTARLMARALRKEPNFGYRVVGYLDDDPDKIGTIMEGAKVHRGVDSAAKYLRRCGITDLIVAMPGAGTERLRTLINSLQHKVDRILFVPDIFGLAVVGTSLQHFFEEQAFAIEVRNNLAEPVNYATKRVFDYISGLILFLLLLAPLFVISVLIKITSKGPVLFKQERIGKSGKPFMCYKFRTMYEDAEIHLKDILDNDSSARAEWEAHWKLRDDPRVTPIGRFLRRTSLDELPQILNVLKGEMSLVGPRPVTREEIVKYYKDMADLCFSVLPGITGLWQVSGRSNTGYGYRIALDSWYVRNWNLWLDIVILLKTLKVVFRKEGAC